jgi:hypothetical protein
MNVTLSGTEQAFILAVGALVFGWLFYRQRIGIVEWMAVEALALRDAIVARRLARIHWREQLKEARGARVVEWRAR